MTKERDILARLDPVRHNDFPVLDSAKEFLAACRLTAFCDPLHWAIVIERSVFATRDSGCIKFQTRMHVFGNCLDERIDSDAVDYIYPVFEHPGDLIFAEYYDEFVRPTVEHAIIRGRLVRFMLAPSEFRKRDISLVFPPRVHGADLLRLLAHDHRDLLLAMDEERIRRIRQPFPELLRLDAWHHPDIQSGQRPSETECFQMLAAAMAKCDASLYRPTEASNTDWRNWPKGGML